MSVALAWISQWLPNGRAMHGVGVIIIHHQLSPKSNQNTLMKTLCLLVLLALPQQASSQCSEVSCALGDPNLECCCCQNEGMTNKTK